MGRLGTLDGLRPLLILWICSFHWEATGVVKEGGEVWPSWFGVVAWSLDKLQRRAAARRLLDTPCWALALLKRRQQGRRRWWSGVVQETRRMARAQWRG